MNWPLAGDGADHIVTACAPQLTWRMIPKSGNRFSDKIMRLKKADHP